MIAIRRFEDGDAQTCCTLINANIPTMGGLNEAARLFVIGKNVPRVLGPELLAFYTVVAVTTDGIEGVGALDGREVKRVHVHPAAQGRGVGKAIMHELEAEARRQGLERLELKASPSSVSFYARLGFHVSESQITVIGDAEFRHVSMRKDLL